jgi:hypothetical protein
MASLSENNTEILKQKAKIRLLTRVLVYPCKSNDINLIKNYLINNQNGKEIIGSSIILDKERFLITFNGNNFDMISINQINEDDLKYSSSQEQVFDNVKEKLGIFINSGHYTKLLGITEDEINSFGTIFCSRGETFECSSKTIFAIISKKYPTYYDANMFIKYENSENKLIHYSNRNGYNYQHSGDNNFNNHLLHTLNPNSNIMNDCKLSIFITGYNKTELWRFKEHNPVILLIDIENKIIYLIEFPLDNISIGDNCLGVACIGEIIDNKLKIKIPSVTVTGNEAAPSYSINTHNLINNIINTNNFNQEILDTENTENKSALDLLTDKIKKEREKGKIESTEVNENFEKKITFVIAGNVPKGEFPIKADYSIVFNNVINVYKNGEPDPLFGEIQEQKNLLLPCFPGPKLSGPPLILLSNGLNGKSNIYEYINNSLTICFVSDEMSSIARDTADKNRLNCIFIIEPKTGPKNNIKQWLYSINKNAVSAMAGPKSTILVHWLDKYYFLEGFYINNFIENVECGSEVDITKIIQYSETEEAYTNPLINIEKCKLELDGNEMTINELIEYFKIMNVSQILNFKIKILNLLSQISRIFDNIEIKNIVETLIPILYDKMVNKNSNKLFSEYRKKLKESWENNNGKIDIKDTDEWKKSKKEYAILKKELNWFVEKLNNLTSEKKTETKNLSIKQLIRNQAIKKNVDTAKNMTQEGFSELLEEKCSILGILCPKVNKNIFNQLLINISDENHQILFEENNKLLEIPDSGVFNLDCTTGGCLMDLGGEYNHDLTTSNEIKLGIPEKPNQNKSLIVIPLFDEFCNIKNPYFISWVEKCNDQDISSFRILMSSYLCNTDLGREKTFNERSKSTRWGQVYIYLKCMYMLPKPNLDNISFNDTISQNMRCLFGIVITTLSSGANPLSRIWQLFRGEGFRPELPTNNETWQYNVILILAKMLPYTCWETNIFFENLIRLLIRLFNNKLASPLTKFLRDAKIEAKKNRGAENDKYLNRLKTEYYPTYDKLIKLAKKSIYQGEKITNEQWSFFDNVFTQFSSRKRNLGGVRIILDTQWNTECFKNKEYMKSLCRHIVKKYQTSDEIIINTLYWVIEESQKKKEIPKLTIERLILKFNEYEVLANEEQESFPYYNDTKKILDILINKSNNKEEINNEIIQEINKLPRTNKVPWRGYEDAFIDELFEGVMDKKIVLNEENKKDNKLSITEEVFQHESNQNKSSLIIASPGVPSMVKINGISKELNIKASTLFEICNLAGFGKSRNEIINKISNMLERMIYEWELSPDLIELHCISQFNEF